MKAIIQTRSFKYTPPEDIKADMVKSALENVQIMGEAYNKKIDYIQTLKGEEAMKYLNRVSRLFKGSYKVFYNDYIKDVLRSFIGYLDVVSLLGTEIKINGWDSVSQNLDIGDMLKIDIDKSTVLPFIGDVRALANLIRGQDPDSKILIDNFFNQLIHNPEIKPTDSDYIHLLNWANSEELSSFNVDSLEKLSNENIIISDAYNTSIIGHYINRMGGIEFLSIKFVDNISVKKRWLKTKGPILHNKKKEVFLDQKFKNILSQMFINDAKLIKKILLEYFNKNYSIQIEEEDFIVETVSLGLIRKQNKENQSFFPELKKIKSPKFTPFLVVRFHSEDKVDYRVVSCQME